MQTQCVEEDVPDAEIIGLRRVGEYRYFSVWEQFPLCVSKNPGSKPYFTRR